MASTIPGTNRRLHGNEETASTIAGGIHEVTAAARHLATNSMDLLRERASGYVEHGQTKVHDTTEMIHGRDRDKPMKSLLLAAAAGFLLGAFWMRR